MGSRRFGVVCQATIVALVLASCGGGSTTGDAPPAAPIVVAPPPPLTQPATPVTGLAARVGFFNPPATVPTLTTRTAFGMINVVDPAQVETSLRAASGTPYTVKIDFSATLLQNAEPAALSMQYTDSSGVTRTKAFAPLSNQKLKRFPADAQIATIMRPYIEIIKKYPATAGTLFLADEPYLNGISKAEMERAGAVVRRELDAAGLTQEKLGVIFASGDFNAKFATHLDRASGDLVRRIDAYYERGLAIRNGELSDPNFDIKNFDSWIASIKQGRLTTYDAAGNMFTGGGIPQGFDVVAFDFYLSSLLLDATHENSLSWLATNVPSAPCGQYAGVEMTSVRNSLSFFDDGPINGGEAFQASDRKILDGLFQCRMGGTLTLLREAVANTQVKVMMISESSANGLLEFYRDGRPEGGQPKLLLEARVLDEVRRGLGFYTTNRGQFQCGLMFFIYDDTFDSSINLQIFGASSMPSVLDEVFKYAAQGGEDRPNECD